MSAEPQRDGGTPPGTAGLRRAATSISALTLLSRILGMARDGLMMSLLGAGWATGAFNLAWMLPNLLRRLFGEGALSAAFVPAYTAALRHRGPEEARHLLGRIAGVVLTGLVAFAVLAVVLCLVLPAGLLGLETGAGPGDPRAGELFLDLGAVLLPYAVPICLVGLYAGALNTHGSFALPAAAPVVLNLFWIGGLLVAAGADVGEPVAMARWVAWALLAGGIAQLVMVLWALRRRRALARPRPGWPRRGEPARAVFAAMAPTVLGLSLVQLNTLIDQAIAVYLVGPGSNNYVYLANRLLLFPHALTSMALAVAVFPSLAALGSDEDRRGLRARVDRATGASVLLSVPAATGLILVAPDLVEVLFHYHRFTDADAGRTVWATGLLVVGLPFLGTVQLHARAFYALGDTATPARVAAWLLLVNLGLGLTLVSATDLGAAALTLATSVTALANAAVLRHLFRRRCPEGGTPSTVIARTVAGAAVMAGVVLAVQALLPGEGKGITGLRLGVGVAAGIAAYGAVHVALRSPELGALRRGHSTRTKSR